MRKVLILLSSFVLLFFSNLSVKAQEASSGQSVAPDAAIGIPENILPPPIDTTSFLGQNHNYSVVFRGNGEAVVSLRAVFKNKGDTPQKEVSLRVPKVEPRELAVYQIIKDKVCIRYKEYPVTIQIYPRPTPECAEYQDPDYYQYYYGASKYQKAQAKYSGDTLTITLPQAVAKEKSGSFFVYYRATGYAKKNIFGSYEFNFESLKVEDDISSLQVGISTDSDIFLRGAKGEVNYRFEEKAVSSFGSAGLSAPVADSAIDNFVNQIGQGSITKTASNLAPLESYTVDGQFADSRLKLFGKEVLIGVLVFVAVIALVFAAVGFVLRSFRKDKTADQGKEEVKNAGGSNLAKGLGVLGLSFISAVFIAGYTFLLFFLGMFVLSSISYQYQSIFALLLLVISFGVYVILLFAPGILLGVKKGVFWGIAQVIMTVFWLVFFLGLTILVFFFMGGSSNYFPPITPMMEKNVY